MVELTMHMKWLWLLKTIQLSQHVVDIELSNKSDDLHGLWVLSI